MHPAESHLTQAIHHRHEPHSNATRDQAAGIEPRSLRTYTPTQAVIARSAGVFHWTVEGRRLYDFSSGVLVANLGHNPSGWLRRFFELMQWTTAFDEMPPPALPMTTYNAITPLEVDASAQLIDCLRRCAGGERMEQVLWAASGSEAVQKALWAALAYDRTRPMILATRHGFHGKKGLAGAVTGTETDVERDPRVRFITFPMQECRDLSLRHHHFDPTPYRQELESLWRQFGRQIGTLITEPYLGGGGSYHPPAAYLQLLQAFCREHDILFLLDEVQANFGRTRNLFAFTSYGLAPDLVILGKGLGNGVPVAATVGRRDVLGSLHYGEASDTWSANPLCAAAVLATLEAFAAVDILGHVHAVSPIIEEGLTKLKAFPFVAHIRGEHQGMVWGVETCDFAGVCANDWANRIVLAAYQGAATELGDGIHLLGPLAGKVIRIAPPLVITTAEARSAMQLLDASVACLAGAMHAHSSGLQRV